MNRLERFYKIDQLLQDRRVVPRQVFLDELEVSAATFKRDLEYLRDRFQAPVIWDREQNGYRYEFQPGAPKFELPGLWFDEQEAYALLMMHHLLSSLDQGGLIGPQIAPLLARLDTILDRTGESADEMRHRVRILSIGNRKLDLEHFCAMGRAVMKHQRVKIHYFSRGTNETTEREISPQRLVYYRENWYVDAWCHLREQLRSFAVDGIRLVQQVATTSTQVANNDLEAHLASGYGIFGGAAVRWATLRFSAERARWISTETWHPDQRGHFDEAGRFVLELPFSNDFELIMDILRHGADVEVISPIDLREKVRADHIAAAERHR